MGDPRGSFSPIKTYTVWDLFGSPRSISAWPRRCGFWPYLLKYSSVLRSPGSSSRGRRAWQWQTPWWLNRRPHHALLWVMNSTPARIETIGDVDDPPKIFRPFWFNDRFQHGPQKPVVFSKALDQIIGADLKELMNFIKLLILTD